MKEYCILAINPGSTSTKTAVFRGGTPLFIENIKHTASSSSAPLSFDAEVKTRKEFVRRRLAEENISLADIDAFVGRGGGLTPCTSGTFEINQTMLDDAKNSHLIHPSTFSPQMAWEFATEQGKKAYMVNSPHTDEFDDISRVTGIARIERVPHVHALNQKEVAIRAAGEMGKSYQSVNFVVAHLGGGISVTAHRRGQMIDSTDVISGDGPMSPTRCGQIDVLSVVDLCFLGEYTKKDLYDLVMVKGGLQNHLGTSDGVEIEAMVKQNSYAKLVFDAMLHQITKSIGAMAAALDGDVDAVLLTGGLIKDPYAAETLTRRVKFIAPVHIYSGEFEMEALSNGVLRLLTGQETAAVYTGVHTWGGLEQARINAGINI